MSCVYVRALQKHAARCPCFTCANMAMHQCDVLRHRVVGNGVAAHFACKAMVEWEKQRYTLLKAHPIDCGKCTECGG